MGFRGSLDDIMITAVRSERIKADHKLFPLVKSIADLLHRKLRRSPAGAGFNVYILRGSDFEYYETLEGVVEFLQNDVIVTDLYYCLLATLRIAVQNEYSTFHNMRRALDAHFNARHPGMYKDD